MKIYDGGSDKDFRLGSITGSSNAIISSTGNQVFISYLYVKGVGNGFSASFTFGKKLYSFPFEYFELINQYFLKKL